MDSSLQKTEKQNPGTCKCNTLHLPAGALGLMPRHICRRAKAGALDDTGVDGRINRLLMTSITTQSALEFCPIHCPNGRLGQDLGFGGIAFALKLPELLNRNLAAV